MDYFLELTKLKQPKNGEKIEKNLRIKKKWKRVERELGTTLPKEYKRLVNRYSTLIINEFLCILNPFDYYYNNLIDRGDIILDAYLVSKSNDPEAFNLPVFPEKNGILPFGYTVNGDELYWRTNKDIRLWSIIVYETRSDEYSEYHMDILEFIYKLCTKQFECPAFPEDLFDNGIELSYY